MNITISALAEAGLRIRKAQQDQRDAARQLAAQLRPPRPSSLSEQSDNSSAETGQQ